MARKILFFLSTDSFHAHVWKAGVLEAPYYFSSNAEGLQRFSEFMQAHRDPAFLLVDLIEEDFRHEVVPHLTGTNHQALVQRKFDQYYRSTPFRMATFQQRQEEGRRDDEMLFSALTNAGRITAWLDLLLQHQVPLAGIYSVPHASAPLVKDIESDHLLLLSWEKDAGLRQTYFFNKRLRFSRLTPIPQGSSFADVIAHESARTHQYLQSLSLTPQGQILNVHIVCHAHDKPLLDTKLQSNHQINFAYLDIQHLAKQFKCQHAGQDSDATPLLLHILASQTPRTSYADNDHSHFYQLWQARRGLFGLAAVTAFVCLIWSALAFMEAGSVRDEIDEFSNQISRINRDTQQIVQQFPASIQGQNGSTVTATDMKTAVTILRSLHQNSATPQQILSGLSATLNNFTRVNTDKISWQSNSNNAAEQEITFHGELLNFSNDYRGALDYFEGLQQTLAKAGYTVTPLQMPLDFSSKGSINDDINLIGQEKPYAFSLKLVWRIQP